MIAVRNEATLDDTGQYVGGEEIRRTVNRIETWQRLFQELRFAGHKSNGGAKPTADSNAFIRG